MKDLKFISPFKKLCITIGNLPTAYIESMSYYEGLTFLVNYLANNVIPAVNNNSEVVKELQDQFVILKNYVDNYFENLDVQEEINNKLDEMADNGELTDIIAQYLGLAGILVYSSVADMKAAENLVEGSKCETYGYYSINDGGAAKYNIRKVLNTDVIDESFIIALNDDTLIAELIIENDEVNIKQLGAYGDNSNNDTNYFKLFSNSNVKTLLIPAGTYKINDIIDLENKNLIGNGFVTIDIFGITTSREHTIQASEIVNIKNINFKQTIAGTNIIGFFGAHDSIIENCSFKVDSVKCNGYFDLYTNNNNIKVKNCKFDCTSLESDGTTNAIGGIWIREMDNNYTSYNITFEDCVIDHQSKDEAIAAWNNTTPCKLSNVQINNCIIKAKGNASCPHLITLNGNNSSFNNCVIERIMTTPSNMSSIFNQNATYAVAGYINNCTIRTNTKHNNGIFNCKENIVNNCEIYDTNTTQTSIGSDYLKIKNSLIDCVTFQCGADHLDIENCKINISSQSAGLSWLFRHSIVVKDSIFNFISADPTQMFQILDSDNTKTIEFYNNIINKYGTTFRFINSGSNDAVLKLNNNINIGQISGSGDISGYITNNIITVGLNTYTNLKANNNFNINA